MTASRSRSHRPIHRPVLPLVEIVAEPVRATIYTIRCAECGDLDEELNGYRAAMMVAQLHREDHHLERLHESLRATGSVNC